MDTYIQYSWNSMDFEFLEAAVTHTENCFPELTEIDDLVDSDLMQLMGGEPYRHPSE
jgi:hypothetical protein